MNILVLTSEPVSAAQLRDALGDAADPEREAQVLVVAPAFHDSPLKFWISDADEAIARAEQVRRETVAKLDSSGVSVSGDVGESDPIEAIDDALKTFPAERIVVFTHEGAAQRYKEDLDAEELSRRYGMPVDRASFAE
jgi:hypothetical protein